MRKFLSVFLILNTFTVIAFSKRELLSVKSFDQLPSLTKAQKAYKCKQKINFACSCSQAATANHVGLGVPQTHQFCLDNPTNHRCIGRCKKVDGSVESLDGYVVHTAGFKLALDAEERTVVAGEKTITECAAAAQAAGHLYFDYVSVSKACVHAKTTAIPKASNDGHSIYLRTNNHAGCIAASADLAQPNVYIPGNLSPARSHRMQLDGEVLEVKKSLLQATEHTAADAAACKTAAGSDKYYSFKATSFVRNTLTNITRTVETNTSGLELAEPQPAADVVRKIKVVINETTGETEMQDPNTTTALTYVLDREVVKDVNHVVEEDVIINTTTGATEKQNVTRLKYKQFVKQVILVNNTAGTETILSEDTVYNVLPEHLAGAPRNGIKTFTKTAEPVIQTNTTVTDTNRDGAHRYWRLANDIEFFVPVINAVYELQFFTDRDKYSPGISATLGGDVLAEAEATAPHNGANCIQSSQQTASTSCAKAFDNNVAWTSVWRPTLTGCGGSTTVDCNSVETNSQGVNRQVQYVGMDFQTPVEVRHVRARIATQNGGVFIIQYSDDATTWTTWGQNATDLSVRDKDIYQSVTSKDVAYNKYWLEATNTDREITLTNYTEHLNTYFLSQDITKVEDVHDDVAFTICKSSDKLVDNIFRDDANEGVSSHIASWKESVFSVAAGDTTTYGKGVNSLRRCNAEKEYFDGMELCPGDDATCGAKLRVQTTERDSKNFDQVFVRASYTSVGQIGQCNYDGELIDGVLDKNLYPLAPCPSTQTPYYCDFAGNRDFGDSNQLLELKADGSANFKCRKDYSIIINGKAIGNDATNGIQNDKCYNKADGTATDVLEADCNTNTSVFGNTGHTVDSCMNVAKALGLNFFSFQKSIGQCLNAQGGHTGFGNTKETCDPIADHYWTIVELGECRVNSQTAGAAANEYADVYQFHARETTGLPEGIREYTNGFDSQQAQFAMEVNDPVSSSVAMNSLMNDMKTVSMNVYSVGRLIKDKIEWASQEEGADEDSVNTANAASINAFFNKLALNGDSVPFSEIYKDGKCMKDGLDSTVCYLLNGTATTETNATKCKEDGNSFGQLEDTTKTRVTCNQAFGYSWVEKTDYSEDTELEWFPTQVDADGIVDKFRCHTLADVNVRDFRTVSDVRVDFIDKFFDAADDAQDMNQCGGDLFDEAVLDGREANDTVFKRCRNDIEGANLLYPNLRRAFFNKITGDGFIQGYMKGQRLIKEYGRSATEIGTIDSGDEGGKKTFYHDKFMVSINAEQLEQCNTEMPDGSGYLLLANRKFPDSPPDGIDGKWGHGYDENNYERHGFRFCRTSITLKKYDKLHDSIQYNEHEKDASGEFRKNYRYTVTVQEEDCQDMEIKEEEAVSQGTAAPFSTEEAEEVFRVDPLTMDWCRTETGHYDADQVDYSDGGVCLSHKQRPRKSGLSEDKPFSTLGYGVDAKCLDASNFDVISIFPTKEACEREAGHTFVEAVGPVHNESNRFGYVAVKNETTGEEEMLYEDGRLSCASLGLTAGKSKFDRIRIALFIDVLAGKDLFDEGRAQASIIPRGFPAGLVSGSGTAHNVLDCTIDKSCDDKFAVGQHTVDTSDIDTGTITSACLSNEDGSVSKTITGETACNAARGYTWRAAATLNQLNGYRPVGYGKNPTDSYQVDEGNQQGDQPQNELTQILGKYIIRDIGLDEAASGSEPFIQDELTTISFIGPATTSLNPLNDEDEHFIMDDTADGKIYNRFLVEMYSKCLDRSKPQIHSAKLEMQLFKDGRGANERLGDATEPNSCLETASLDIGHQDVIAQVSPILEKEDVKVSNKRVCGPIETYRLKANDFALHPVAYGTRRKDRFCRSCAGGANDDGVYQCAVTECEHHDMQSIYSREECENNFKIIEAAYIASGGEALTGGFEAKASTSAAPGCKILIDDKKLQWNNFRTENNVLQTRGCRTASIAQGSGGTSNNIGICMKQGLPQPLNMLAPCRELCGVTKVYSLAASNTSTCPEGTRNARPEECDQNSGDITKALGVDLEARYDFVLDKTNACPVGRATTSEECLSMQTRIASEAGITLSNTTRKSHLFSTVSSKGVAESFSLATGLNKCNTSLGVVALTEAECFPAAAAIASQLGLTYVRDAGNLQTTVNMGNKQPGCSVVQEAGGNVYLQWNVGGDADDIHAEVSPVCVVRTDKLATCPTGTRAATLAEVQVRAAQIAKHVGAANAGFSNFEVAIGNTTTVYIGYDLSESVDTQPAGAYVVDINGKKILRYNTHENATFNADSELLCVADSNTTFTFSLGLNEHGNVTTNTCAAGSSSPSKAECEAYVNEIAHQLSYTYLTDHFYELNSEHHPIGCAVDFRDDKLNVFYNAHDTGKRQDKMAPICVAKSTETDITYLEEENADAPKGCYVSDTHIRFNTHNTGRVVDGLNTMCVSNVEGETDFQVNDPLLPTGCSLHNAEGHQQLRYNKDQSMSAAVGYEPICVTESDHDTCDDQPDQRSYDTFKIEKSGKDACANIANGGVVSDLKAIRDIQECAKVAHSLGSNAMVYEHNVKCEVCVNNDGGAGTAGPSSHYELQGSTLASIPFCVEPSADHYCQICNEESRACTGLALKSVNMNCAGRNWNDANAKLAIQAKKKCIIGNLTTERGDFIAECDKEEGPKNLDIIDVAQQFQTEGNFYGAELLELSLGVSLKDTIEFEENQYLTLKGMDDRIETIAWVRNTELGSAAKARDVRSLGDLSYPQISSEEIIITAQTFDREHDQHSWDVNMEGVHICSHAEDAYLQSYVNSGSIKQEVVDCVVKGTPAACEYVFSTCPQRTDVGYNMKKEGSNYLLLSQYRYLHSGHNFIDETCDMNSISLLLQLLEHPDFGLKAANDRIYSLSKNKQGDEAVANACVQAGAPSAEDFFRKIGPLGNQKPVTQTLIRNYKSILFDEARNGNRGIREVVACRRLAQFGDDHSKKFENTFLKGYKDPTAFGTLAALGAAFTPQKCFLDGFTDTSGATAKAHAGDSETCMTDILSRLEDEQSFEDYLSEIGTAEDLDKMICTQKNNLWRDTDTKHLPCKYNSPEMIDFDISSVVQPDYDLTVDEKDFRLASTSPSWDAIIFHGDDIGSLNQHYAPGQEAYTLPIKVEVLLHGSTCTAEYDAAAGSRRRRLLTRKHVRGPKRQLLQFEDGEGVTPDARYGGGSSIAFNIHVTLSNDVPSVIDMTAQGDEKVVDFDYGDENTTEQEKRSELHKVVKKMVEESHHCLHKMNFNWVGVGFFLYYLLNFIIASILAACLPDNVTGKSMSIFWDPAAKK